MTIPFPFKIILLVALTVSCNRVKKDYYDSGILKSQVHFDKENLWHGHVKLYNENGLLDFESNYIHGQPDGFAKFYYPDGKIRMIKYFEKGIINGEVHGFDTTGILNYIEKHSNGKFLSYRWFDNNGDTTSGINFLDVDSLPLLSEFKINFSNNSDTFIIGDTVFIDIKHPSVFKNQIILRTSNGGIIYHWERDSFLYEFLPKNPGYTSLIVSLRINNKLNKNIGVLKYKVKEK